MNSSFTEQESLFVDYAKAIGIMSVVIGHYRWNPLNIYSPYIYHMPFFFIIGGVLMKPIGDVRKWAKGIFSKYVLYVAFWYTVIYLITEFLNRYLGASIQSTIGVGGVMDWITYPIIRNMHNNVLFLVGWFFIAYLLATSLFKIEITMLKPFSKNIYFHRTTLAIYGVLVGYASIRFFSPLFRETHYWLYNLACQVGVGHMFVSIGYLVRPYLKIFSSITLLLLSIAVMFTFKGNGTFSICSMAWSQYPGNFFEFLSGVLTSCFTLFSIAYIFRKSTCYGPLQAMGRNSKDIMSLHLLLFVLIDLVLSRFGLFSGAKVDGANNLRPAGPNFWAIYIGFGLFFPLLIRKAVDYVKQSAKVTESVTIEFAKNHFGEKHR